MSGVPYTFASATSSIPLSELDSNFATPVTIGTTSVTLGNTVTTLANVSLSNVTISSVASVIPNNFVANSSVIVNGTSNVAIASANGAVTMVTNGNTAVTIDTAQKVTLVNDATIHGLTVGQGGGSVSTNTAVGASALAANTTGSSNTAVGNNSGSAITTGSKNTIIGGYTGNQGGLDIRTASNYIVLSDGDGNLRIVNGAYPNAAGSFAAAAGCTTLGIGGTSATYDGILYLNGSSSTGWGPCIAGRTNGTQSWYVGSYSYVVSGTSQNLTCQTGTNGVQLASGATAWTSASDPRLKNITGTYENALADIAKIQPIKFTWKADESNKPCVGVDASTVVGVIPEAVDECEVVKDDDTKYLHVRYTELIPLMIASIKELSAQVTTLQTQVTALQSKG